jgi:hypothetical protein
LTVTIPLFDTRQGPAIPYFGTFIPFFGIMGGGKPLHIVSIYGYLIIYHGGGYE